MIWANTHSIAELIALEHGHGERQSARKGQCTLYQFRADKTDLFRPYPRYLSLVHEANEHRGQVRCRTPGG
jgi:hypothetical protein